MYSATKTLEEFAEDVDETDASSLQAQIEKTGSLVSGDDPAALEAAIEELSRLSYALTERLYATLGGMDEEIGGEEAAPEPDDDAEA